MRETVIWRLGASSATGSSIALIRIEVDGLTRALNPRPNRRCSFAILGSSVTYPRRWWPILDRESSIKNARRVAESPESAFFFRGRPILTLFHVKHRRISPSVNVNCPDAILFHVKQVRKIVDQGLIAAVNSIAGVFHVKRATVRLPDDRAMPNRYSCAVFYLKMKRTKVSLKTLDRSGKSR